MGTVESWIDKQRAESTVKLLFARIPNCFMTPMNVPDAPFDFLLTFLSPPKNTYVLDIVAVSEAPSEAIELKYSRDKVARINRLEFPLFLIVVDISLDKPYYGWVKPSAEYRIPVKSGTSISISIPVAKLDVDRIEQIIKIRKTTTFRVKHNKGDFSVFISEHRDGTYYGTVLYYTKLAAQHGTPRTLSFDHKRFKARSFVDVKLKCTHWIDENLGGNYAIKEVPASEPD